jgi:hypothetical protein
MMISIGWRGLTGALALALAAVSGVYAGRMLAPHAEAQDAPPQDAAAPPAQPAPPPAQRTAAPAPDIASAQERDSAHLASILAPVALYPDPLLNNILTAATYPLEVVEADRWLDNPANAALSGDQLETAMQQRDWDPAVKSLLPFQPILKMMDNQLDWTQQLGDAFLAEQDQVMDMVQQLRRQAQAAGGLVSTQQQSVATDPQGAVAIEPANPQEVSVPAYDPNAAYGDWPYPEAPPDAFAAYGAGDFDPSYGDGWYFGPPVLVTTPIWFWGQFDWHHHRIEVNRDRFARLDPPHRFTVPGEWQHDPTHRHGVAYREAGLQQRFQPERAAALRPALGAEPSRSFGPPTQTGFSAGRSLPVAPLSRSLPAMAHPTYAPPPAFRSPAAAPAPQPLSTMAHPIYAPPPDQIRVPSAPAFHPAPAAAPRPVMQSAPPARSMAPAPAHATGAASGAAHGFAR